MFKEACEFDFEKIKEEIKNSSQRTAIYVGCDSKKFKRNGKMQICYVTTIILHLDSSRGGKIYKAIEFHQDWANSIRQRLMHEVMLASNAALELTDVIGNRPFEIHLDINPSEKYKSSVVSREAIGYIMGTHGIKPKLKPEAFAATAVSDKYAVSTASHYRH